MSPGKRKASLGMVKRCAAPVGGAVAAFAGRRQTQSNVIDWRLGTVVVLLMAAHAGRSGQVVIVVDVAHRAGRRRMLSGQGKARQRVIERRWLPGHCGVAILTGLGQVQRNMVEGSQGRLIIRQMAGYARNARKLSVIELRSRPAIDAVANRAIRRELGGDVIRRLRLLKLLRMAGVAIRRETFELSVGRLFVTRIAIHHGMRSYQWKAVLMILNQLTVGFPAFDRVTGLAIRTHLSAMNIRMAIGALRSNICENGFRMALRAGHIRVHAAQRVFRLFVIEFGDRADRLPSSLGVAVLTGNGQRAVRAPRTIVGAAPP